MIYVFRHRKFRKTSIMYCTIYQTYVLMSGTIDTLDVWIDLFMLHLLHSSVSS
jgi:hypothetical protein